MVIHKVPYVIARMEKQRDGIGKNSGQRTAEDIKKIIKLKTDVSYKISKIEAEVKEYQSCLNFFNSDECSILCSISAETMINTINGQIHRGEWQRVYRANVRENGKSTEE
jgi:recombinational DNA repair protein RecR